MWLSFVVGELCVVSCVCFFTTNFIVYVTAVTAVLGVVPDWLTSHSAVSRDDRIQEGISKRPFGLSSSLRRREREREREREMEMLCAKAKERERV